jgi:hypothetical protein
MIESELYVVVSFHTIMRRRYSNMFATLITLITQESIHSKTHQS